MKQSIDKKRIVFYLWLAVGYFLLGVFTTLGTYPGRFIAVICNNAWGVAYATVFNYILFEYTVPFVLRKRSSALYNILISIPLLFVHLMLYSYGSYVWRLFGIQLHIYTALKNFTTLDLALQSVMAYNVGSVFLFGIFRHGYNYIQLKQATQQLRIQKQEAELNYLKAQTNPHFLFNTLNNIYSLSRDKSDLAPESILRLSQILRYMLYETGGAFIAIEQELKIISDYIALEKLRYDDSLQINFNYDIEDMRQALPPLLLIPLVENAFKHGASETRGNAFVSIHLAIQQRQLKLTVKNSAEAGTGTVKENIGLSNLRRQLELLYTDYQLALDQKDAVFTASLKINLGSHV